MKLKRVWRICAWALAALCLLTLLPAAALAEDEPAGDTPVMDTPTGGTPRIEDPNVTYLAEENVLLATNSLVAGKEAKLYIPVINRGDGEATNLSCVLPYSGDPLAFPFEGSAELTASPFKKFDKTANNGKGGLVDWDGSVLAPGDRAWFELTGAKALTSLAQGNMELVFQIGYSGTMSNIKLGVYVRNASWSAPSGGGTSFKSKPKVIIESYSFDRDRIYAGDTVRVNICVRNTAPAEDIANLQFDFSDEGGKILPVSGGSNSVYLGTIKKAEAYQMVLFLNVAPDAEAKTHKLGVKLVYEGTKNRAEFTAETSIAIAVQQRIRVRLTEPAIYGDAWVGQSVSMGMSMYNLSKATIYNCSAEVEGDGLRLEEPFFGGNIAAGGTMRADLSVIPDQAGEVKGTILISYEDMYGTPTTESVDFDLLVNDMQPMDGMESMAPMPEAEAPAGGLAWYWWLIIGVAVLAGAVVLILTLRKRRKKFLEEL